MYLYRNRPIGLAFIFILIFSSCEQKKIDRNDFFPIEKIIGEQALLLSSSHADLHKKATLNDSLYEVSTTPADSMAWSHELDIFRELELINKPIYKDDYVITDNINDPKSNLVIKEFRATRNIPVSLVKIFHRPGNEDMIKMEAIYNEENSLYRSSRHMSLVWDDHDGNQVLTSYAIKGGQKIFLGDTTVFEIQGKIAIK
jgi:hypothetical protein